MGVKDVDSHFNISKESEEEYATFQTDLCSFLTRRTGFTGVPIKSIRALLETKIRRGSSC